MSSNTNSSTAPNDSSSTGINYGEALQKSLLFYEAQRSGPLPEGNRIEWRGDSALQDGSDVGIDLTGGYYDAGDHVKFGFPMAASMTMLSWGALEYKDAYVASGQLDELKEAVRWGTDFLLKAHVSENGETKAFYGQVGDGNADHAYWGAAENMTMGRPAFKIDAANPGSDLAGESAAALAAASMLFRDSDPAYADELLENAKQLYAFADQYRGKYSDSIPNASDFYNSWSGYEDELAWGASWLYRATGDATYLGKAEAAYQGLSRYTHTWDNKSYGTAVMLSQQTDNFRYQQDVESWLNWWSDDSGGGIAYTDGGLAWVDQWGSLRLSANTAFLAGVYGDTVNDPNGRYTNFSEQQIDYMLGDNPSGFSYMVGFGDSSPQQPHHRGSHGGGWDDLNSSAPNDNILYGALVGGPASPVDGDYQDSRDDYIRNEVALDYNAAFTGALARQYDQFGGTPLSAAELNALPGISETDVDETPVDETPVDETPVDETPVDETPVDETPVDETPVDETPVDETPVDETPVDETPVDETPVDETPVDETPVDETPVDETPVDETPVDETPVDETPVDETPVDETPVDETPVDETPVDETPVDETPVDETPVDETPVDETPVDETPVDETPVDETPVDETPVDETPVDETPVDETPVDETPVDETPVDETPVDETPVDETPVDETPVDETPVDETPVDETPVDETPVDETPVDETPVDETPVDETPVDETPVDETPVDETPVDETPVDETPVDETPVDETPVDETPVDETPVDETPVDETPVDKTPVDETPIDKTPVDKMPTEKAPTDGMPTDEAPTNETPTDLSLSNESIDENSEAGSTIGTLSTTDPDSGDTFTYELVEGVGDTDNAQFEIVGGELNINASPDFETQSSYSIRVRTTDAAGESYEEALTISVNDIADETIVGTNRKDNLRGTSKDEQFDGLSGNDNIRGLGGDDFIKGARGSDILRGNVGDDVIHGNAGRDRLIGGKGDDMLYGGGGRDRLRGRSGNDILDGGKGSDRLRGGEGKDIFVLAENAGVDTILDFNANKDMLYVKALSFGQLDITQQGRFTEVAVSGTGDVLARLKGVNPGQLNADNVISALPKVTA